MPEDFGDEGRRRFPAKFKQIDEIDPQDVRVSIIGTVVDKSGETLILDDGTGKVEVEFDLDQDLDEFESGGQVRIIGRPSEGRMSGEAVQDFSDFDLKLYEKALSKLRKVEDQL